MTKPTTGRLVLWSVLSGVWCLLVVQALLMQPVGDTYIPGAVFWAVVQGWLVWMLIATYRRKRASE